jgi:hypothetical protein
VNAKEQGNELTADSKSFFRLSGSEIRFIVLNRRDNGLDSGGMERRAPR